ncbi:MAG: ornithine--oxo-acid transaminase [bacterium]|nr:ornithine--oxo-acid transaminase [bacterium]
MKSLLDTANRHLAKHYGWLKGFFPVSAKGCWITDDKGRRYLDMISCYSAMNFGYGHPVLIAAAKEQLNTGLTLTTGGILHCDKILLAKELAEFCGMDEAMVVSMNTGAEAVETAMKLVRKWGYAKKRVPLDKAEIIFCENNFHGRTIGIISASTIGQYRDMFKPLLPGIKVIPFGSARALAEAITPNTVALIVEPIQGEGGIVVPPLGYLKDIRAICFARNVLLVFDEIQTGLGRTGDRFACDFEEVRPDLFTLGKALGGGIVPISAVVGVKKVMEVFQPGDHGSTFGGNPEACHIARAVLRLMKKTRLEEQSQALGFYFRSKLDSLAHKLDYIKEIRGRGLMIGVEIKGSYPTGHDLCEALFEERIIAKETRDNVLRISPPLVITKKEIDWAMVRIQKVFSKFSAKGRGR